MVIKIVRILSIIMVCGGVLFSSNPAFAQDKGTPVMRTVTFFTLGGAGAGAALGVAYYMLDPLNPDADIRNDILVGMGLGTFAGLIFGFVQLNKQVIMPNSSPMPDNEFNQPYLGGLPPLPQNYQLSQNTPFQGINKPNDAFVHPRILLFGLQVRF
jgi:hypothetical protein